MGESDRTQQLLARHLRFGWGGLLVFLSLGLGLEALHGLKIGWYLDATSEARRLMWTLAHAHGTLLALVHLGFALTLSLCPTWSGRGREQASLWLCGATIAMPLGFLLGGVTTYGGDPGVGIALVALGGLMLFVAVLLTLAGAGKPAVSTAATKGRPGSSGKKGKS